MATIINNAMYCGMYTNISKLLIDLDTINNHLQAYFLLQQLNEIVAVSLT